MPTKIQLEIAQNSYNIYTPQQQKRYIAPLLQTFSNLQSTPAKKKKKGKKGEKKPNFIAINNHLIYNSDKNFNEELTKNAEILVESKKKETTQNLNPEKKI